MITKSIRYLGLTDYFEIDKNDYFFNELRLRVSDYRFIPSDVTNDPIEGKFEMIGINDVLQHVVTREKLNPVFRIPDALLENNGKYCWRHYPDVLSKDCLIGIVETQ